MCGLVMDSVSQRTQSVVATTLDPQTTHTVHTDAYHVGVLVRIWDGDVIQLYVQILEIERHTHTHVTHVYCSLSHNYVRHAIGESVASLDRKEV